MPATAPGPVSVPLLNGSAATVSQCDTQPQQRVQIEIPLSIGTFREAAWRPGTDRSRKQLVNNAFITETDAIAIETAAIKFLNDISLSKAGGAATFSPIEVEGFAHGAKERQSFMVNSFADFSTLLSRPVGPGYFLDWGKNLKLITNMDADWHDVKRGRPNDDTIDDLMYNLKPTPAIVNRTGRGFHAFYAPYGKFTADELASTAMAGLLDNPLVSAYGGTAELLTRTRHPLSEHNGRTYGLLRHLKQDDLMPALACFTRVSCDDEEAREAAEHLGLQVGKRYSHDHCPMRPEHKSSSPDPVVVHADGVHCFSCGRTWSWGTLRRKAGLSMKTTAETAIIRDAIANWVPHRQVARYFEALAPWLGCNLPPRMREHLFRCLHRALIKRHFQEDLPPGFDLKLGAVFDDFPYVRSVSGLWLHQDSLTIVQPKPERADMVHCSSALQPHTTKEGLEILEPDLLMAGRLAKNGDIPGWMPIVAIPVSPIWHIHNDPASNVSSLACHARPMFRDPLKYIEDPTARMPMAECEAAFNRRFPNINMPYMTLIHIARGLGEQGSCQLPIIWATGQTGTGKTSHLYVEAALHDETPENLSGADISKIRDMIGEAQGRTGLISFDDFAKAADSKQTAYKLEDYLQLILQYNRSLTFHKRHVAMLCTLIHTVLVLTELKQPRSFMTNKQLGRRVGLVPLEIACNWSASDGDQQRAGFTNWWRESPELRKAAESWHSWVIDKYLPAGATMEWKHYVEACGFQMLSDYADNDEVAGGRVELVRNFAQALLAAPSCDVSIEKHVFKGAKEIILGAANHLSTAAQELVEFNEMDEISSETIRLALEPYQGLLHQILPFNGPCNIQVGRKCARVFVRLREQGKRNHCVANINEGCLLPGVTVQNLLLCSQD